MIYKIGNLADLERLPLIDDTALELLYHHAKVLETEYGKERAEDSDGGYILFAPSGTNAEELKALFDVSEHTAEYVNKYCNLCEAVYLLNNDYAVVIVMSIADAPTEILNEIDN